MQSTTRNPEEERNHMNDDIDLNADKATAWDTPKHITSVSIFGDENLEQKPHIDKGLLDSISVHEEDLPFHRDMDNRARKVWDGYY
jgi:hypothetical protein